MVIGIAPIVPSLDNRKIIRLSASVILTLALFDDSDNVTIEKGAGKLSEDDSADQILVALMRSHRRRRL